MLEIAPNARPCEVFDLIAGVSTGGNVIFALATPSLANTFLQAYSIDAGSSADEHPRMH